MYKIGHQVQVHEHMTKNTHVDNISPRGNEYIEWVTDGRYVYEIGHHVEVREHKRQKISP